MTCIVRQNQYENRARQELESGRRNGNATIALLASVLESMQETAADAFGDFSARTRHQYLTDVYSMRMARVNITMPDDLYARARRAGLNVSQLAQRAVVEELNRMTKIAELDAYLEELEQESGPTTETERAKAKAWADKALGGSARRHSA